jgi:hypothetical protein
MAEWVRVERQVLEIEAEEGKRRVDGGETLDESTTERMALRANYDICSTADRNASQEYLTITTR